MTYTSEVEEYWQNGYQRFRITLGDSFCVIATSGVRSANGRIIWVQSNKPGEMIRPHDFIQSLGEGLEAAGITPPGEKK